MEKVGEKGLKKKARIIFLLVLAATVVVAAGLFKLRFDYDFEKFFPANDEESVFFRQHRAKFESDNDFLLIAIEHKKGIFDLGFLKEVDELTQELKAKVPHVLLVASITNQNETLILPGGIKAENPYIHFNRKLLKQDSTRIYNSKELINSLVSKDGKSLCIFIRHKDYIVKKESDVMLAKLNSIVDKYDFEGVHIAGRTVGQKLYVEKMIYEMIFFLCLSAVLIVIFLIIAFRSFWGIFIPLFVILLSTVWVIGLMGWFDEPINILLVTLPCIMFVVGMSDVIHLVSKYLDALREDHSKLDAIKITLKEVGFSTFVTAVTTSLGFFTLYFVNVQPIQVFGIVAGIGVFIAFVITMVLLPVLLYLFPSPLFIAEKRSENVWLRHLRRWFIFVLRKRKIILAIYTIICVVSLIGLSFMKTNNYLMDDLRADEPLKQDFNYLDKHYGGIRPFEVAVILKDSSMNLWDLEVLQEMEKVENYLENVYGAEVKNSLVGTLKVVNRSAHAGNPADYQLPQTKRELKKYRRAIRGINQGKYLRILLDENERVSRINGNFPDIGNHAIANKNEEFKRFTDGLALKGKLEFKVTGTAHLFDKNMRYLSVNLVEGLSFEIVLVALIMGFLYKSVRMMVISMIPNLIPLLVISGIMGFFGVDLKISTAIIFTIALGIAIDDTIHILGKFKFEGLKGKSKNYALKTAYLTTGKAMILTSLVLCSGFFMLVFSSFNGTFYMGLLLCITLFVALITELTLLPVLIYMFYNPKQKR